MKEILISLLILSSTFAQAADDDRLDEFSTRESPFTIVQRLYDGGTALDISEIPSINEIFQGAQYYRLKATTIVKKTKLKEILAAEVTPLVRLKMNYIIPAVPEVDNGPAFPSHPGRPAQFIPFEMLSECTYLDGSCAKFESQYKNINVDFYGNLFLFINHPLFPRYEIRNGDLYGKVNVIDRCFKTIGTQTATYRKNGKALIIKSIYYNKRQKIIKEFYRYGWLK